MCDWAKCLPFRQEKKNLKKIWIEIRRNMASVGASFLRNTLNPIALLEGFQRGSLNRAQRGLYAGRQIGFGNSISFSESK
jgi:hypothetical protein